jgi:hypothetical protein
MSAFRYAAPLLVVLVMAVVAIVTVRLTPPINKTTALAIGAVAVWSRFSLGSSGSAWLWVSKAHKVQTTARGAVAGMSYLRRARSTRQLSVSNSVSIRALMSRIVIALAGGVNSKIWWT